MREIAMDSTSQTIKIARSFESEPPNAIPPRTNFFLYHQVFQKKNPTKYSIVASLWVATTIIMRNPGFATGE